MSPDIAHADTIASLLTRVRAGEPGAQGLLFERIYEDLRRLAHAVMSTERSDHTLGTTALVHEAYLRLSDSPCLKSVEDRQCLLALATCVMRRLLIDHARRRNAQRRGGAAQRVLLDAVLEDFEQANSLDVLELDDALEQLSRWNARQAEVVQLRWIGGMSMADIAAHLGVSRVTVEKDYALAKAWLNLRLNP